MKSRKDDTKPLRRARPDSKVGQLCTRLTSMAYDLGPGKRLPTLIQLQEQLGVTPATIDRALRQLERQRVIRREHGRGIFVAPSLTKTICLLCEPSFFRGAGASPFWNILVEASQEEAIELGRSFSFYFTRSFGDQIEPLHSQAMADMAEGRVHGVIGIGISPEVLTLVESYGIPVAGFAAPINCGVSVLIDSYTIVYLGVAALAKQGCTKIGLWRPVGPYRVADQRSDHSNVVLQPFIEALTALGLSYDEQLVHQVFPLPDDHPEFTASHQQQGYDLAIKVFGGDEYPKPDGLVITDDLMTQGVIAGLFELGIRVGDDIKVASHANKGSMTLLGYQKFLTLIEVDPAEIAHILVKGVDSLINGHQPENQLVRVIPRLRVD